MIAHLIERAKIRAYLRGYNDAVCKRRASSDNLHYRAGYSRALKRAAK